VCSSDLGTPPQVAGSAAARGEDDTGNVVIVSVGGMSQAAQGTDGER